MMEFICEEVETPVGGLYLVTSGGYLVALDYEGFEQRRDRLLQAHWGAFSLHAALGVSEAARRVKDYFAGSIRAVDGVETRTKGTEFQREVWAELRRVAPGSTISYGELAERLKRPGSARAVGAANGSNPVAIIVPCHRVIGSRASLTGYAGGLERKRWLLQHESIWLGRQASLLSHSGSA